ncbi:Glucan endo-1 3-beta-glucosidase 2 [Bienertia sinuspersici]
MVADILALLLALTVVSAEDAFIGVNIGTDLSDMPHPTQVVALLRSQHIRHVRLFDADRGMLTALANTGIQVSISVPNDQILGIGQSNSTAAKWVSQNVVGHYPATNITSVCVGSEVFNTIPNAAPILVKALQFIQSALVASRLDDQIKVSTPLSTSVILDSFPPSQAFFNHSLNPVLIPILKFLQSTKSYLMLNIYPYYDYMYSNGVIPLDYALFQPLSANKEAVDANTLLHYTNVFDAMVDAAYFAMADLNFTNIPIIEHQKHPGIAVSTYIYELYNEDAKSGSTAEKNWGLFDANGKPVYILHLTESGSVLANDTTNQTYCSARNGADKKMLQAALDWACGPGKVDCSPLLQQTGKTPESCDFNGVAEITTTDPSHGKCTYQIGGLNGTFANASAPSMNSMSSGSPSSNEFSQSHSLLLTVEIITWSIIFLQAARFV